MLTSFSYLIHTLQRSLHLSSWMELSNYVVFPITLSSDRDLVFISHFWKEFFKMSSTQLNMTSSYHPQRDGQTEVINRCLEQYLRCFISQQPKKWTTYLPWAEYWYNTTHHISTKMSPFRLLMVAFHRAFPPMKSAPPL